MSTKPPLHILLGPTASGKERTALELATRWKTGIISADSMKIYHEMGIGTATPPLETRQRIQHWCVDMVDPAEAFSVAMWIDAAEEAMAEIDQLKKPILISGGTALYYKGLTEGLFEGPSADATLRDELLAEVDAHGAEALHARLMKHDPVSAEKLHPNDVRRVIRALEVVLRTGVPISEQQTQFGHQRTDRPVHMVGLLWEREELIKRIDARVDRMMAEGLLAEARCLYDRQPPAGMQASQAVGYAEFFRHFSGEYDLDTAIALVKQNTRRLAKSQMTWFRKFPCQWVTMRHDMTAVDVANEVETLFRTQNPNLP